MPDVVVTASLLVQIRNSTSTVSFRGTSRPVRLAEIRPDALQLSERVVALRLDQRKRRRLLGVRLLPASASAPLAKPGGLGVGHRSQAARDRLEDLAEHAAVLALRPEALEVRAEPRKVLGDVVK